MITNRARSLGLSFALPVLLSGCCKITGDCPVEADCKPIVQSLTNSFNTFAANGSAVATFRLTQEHQSFPARCSGVVGGPVSLSVTGIAPVPLRFDYTLQGLGATGLVVWTNSGTVPRLAPGQRLNVGQVAQTPVRIDIAARALLLNILTVP